MIHGARTRVRGGREEQTPDGALRPIRTTAIATVVVTYLLIVLGSTVRVTNSGMGCSSWPLCNGQAVPTGGFHPFMEQSHRYLATFVTLLIVLFVVLVWRAGTRARHLRRWATASVGVVALQIVLGAITVVTKNAPVTVAAHLIVALLFLAIVTVAAVAASTGLGQPRSLPPRLQWLAWASVAALFLILLSGSLVVNGGAQAACESWPACVASSAPTRLVALQLVHRSLVLIGTVVATTYLIALARRHDSRSPSHALAWVALALLVIQIAVGAVNAVNGAPAVLADLHLALAAALWTVVVAVVVVPANATWGVATVRH